MGAIPSKAATAVLFVLLHPSVHSFGLHSKHYMYVGCKVLSDHVFAEAQRYWNSHHFLTGLSWVAGISANQRHALGRRWPASKFVQQSQWLFTGDCLYDLCDVVATTVVTFFGLQIAFFVCNWIIPCPATPQTFAFHHFVLCARACTCVCC